jgi:tetratricopeptide (TPR) repeat protein
MSSPTRFFPILLAFCIVFTTLVIPVRLSAERNDLESSWILLEKAKSLIAEPGGQRMGEALELLRKAIEEQSLFPEAEIAIGEIYFREGALELAKTQLAKVLQKEYRDILLIPDEVYDVLYRLAEINERQGEYGSMEKRLQEVLNDHPVYAQPESQRLRTAMLNTYLVRGLNQTFRLYRLENARFAQLAYSKLGWFYYRWGRFEPASIMHSLFALDIMITESVAEIRRFSPLYEFKTFEDFLDVALKRENVRDYLVSNGFFRATYYLAAATFAAGHPARASETFRLLAGSRAPAEDIGPHRDLARKQLKSPWVEPYLNPSARRIEYPTD